MSYSWGLVKHCVTRMLPTGTNIFVRTEKWSYNFLRIFSQRFFKHFSKNSISVFGVIVLDRDCRNLSVKTGTFRKQFRCS